MICSLEKNYGFTPNLDFNSHIYITLLNFYIQGCSMQGIRNQGSPGRGNLGTRLVCSRSRDKRTMYREAGARLQVCQHFGASSGHHVD